MQYNIKVNNIKILSIVTRTSFRLFLFAWIIINIIITNTFLE